MDIDRIVADLKREMDSIGRAIATLTGLGSGGSAGKRSALPAKRKRGGLTPDGRRRLSQAMKKRWAARRKSTSSKMTARRVTTSAPVKRGSGLSAAARKRLSEAMKRRWAEGKMGRRAKTAAR